LLRNFLIVAPAARATFDARPGRCIRHQRGTGRL
jgi:hypothetical protein